MKSYVLILLAFSSLSVNAQLSQAQNVKGQVLITDGSVVGIGTANEPCALLQLDAIEKALLLTRIAGANAEAMQPVPGIIVYITDGDGLYINSIGYWGYTDHGEGGTWRKFVMTP